MRLIDFIVATGPLLSYYLVASCGNDDMVKLWHIRGGLRCTMTLSYTLQGHTGNVNCCRFSQDGSLLASAYVENIFPVI